MVERCRHCNAEIYFDRRQRTEDGKWIPMDVRTHEKHDCVSNPKHPMHKKYFDEGDSDNTAIGRMFDAKVKNEIASKTLKPTPLEERAMREELERLRHDLYSKDSEFQDYKRKSETKIKELEERIKTIEDRLNRIGQPRNP